MVATLKRTPKKVHKDQTKPPLRVVTAQDNGVNDDFILVQAGQLISVRADIVALRKKEKKIGQVIQNAGITMKQMNEGIKINDLDPEAVTAHFRGVLRISKALGAPIGTQLSFFADASSKGDSVEDQMKKAFDWGRTLGLLGKFPDEQMYQPESQLGQEHTKGWQSGQQVRYEQLTRNSEEEAQRVKDVEAKKAKKASSGPAKAEAAVRDAMEKNAEDKPEEPEAEKTADDEEV